MVTMKNTENYEQLLARFTKRIEQIFRARGDEDKPEDVRRVIISMGIRKYLYRQAWIFNVIWFIGYFILMFTVGRQQPQAMPDLIWQG